jgi:hypothetical protein
VPTCPAPRLLISASLARVTGTAVYAKGIQHARAVARTQHLP